MEMMGRPKTTNGIEKLVVVIQRYIIYRLQIYTKKDSEFLKKLPCLKYLY